MRTYIGDLRIVLALVLSLVATLALASKRVYSSEIFATGKGAYVQALVSQQNGEEVFVVQPAKSNLQSQSTWIIPVPSKPVSVEEALNAKFQALDRRLSRFERSDPMPTTLHIVGLSLLISLAGIGLAFYGPKTHRRGVIVAATFLAVVLSAITFPVFAQAKVSAKGGSLFEIGQQLDIYHVKAMPASTWLKSNDHSLDPGAKSKLDVMAQQGGWVVELQPTRPQTGYSPVPVAIRFNTDHPVCPMPISNDVNGPVVLNLFTVGSGTAQTPSLTAWVSEPWAFDKSRIYSPYVDQPGSGRKGYRPAQITHEFGLIRDPNKVDYLTPQIGEKKDFIRKVAETDLFAHNGLLTSLLIGSSALWILGFFAPYASKKVGPRMAVVCVLAFAVAVGSFVKNRSPMERAEPGYYISRMPG